MTDDDSGAMRHRAWTIAAAFHEPADYDVPSAPQFEGAVGDGGELRLLDDDGRLVLTAGVPVRARR
ncbi:hypothetical protein Hbl1158_03590 [Halobaculum sp. CBA1158]|uniref:hypothetical protein n=1 Tax=Halobaculum sp. CBA1158 TaxID=2904243 RepID=UPI001F1F4207|nr:hypothetical protein [Halobaculum sp. CBA1158]UIP00458.1 hypothetical protein Hbl1158_03590 [Halobaculum sp. CBA1158]